MNPYQTPQESEEPPCKCDIATNACGCALTVTMMACMVCVSLAALGLIAMMAIVTWNRL